MVQNSKNVRHLQLFSEPCSEVDGPGLETPGVWCPSTRVSLGISRPAKPGFLVGRGYDRFENCMKIRSVAICCWISCQSLIISSYIADQYHIWQYEYELYVSQLVHDSTLQWQCSHHHYDPVDCVWRHVFLKTMYNDVHIAFKISIVHSYDQSYRRTWVFTSSSSMVHWLWMLPMMYIPSRGHSESVAAVSGSVGLLIGLGAAGVTSGWGCCGWFATCIPLGFHHSTTIFCCVHLLFLLMLNHVGSLIMLNLFWSDAKLDNAGFSATIR